MKILHRFSPVLVAVSLLLHPLFGALAHAQSEGPSILRPDNARLVREYRFPINAVDPSSPRGENQLVVYTSGYGSSTGTSENGWEAVVSNGAITGVNGFDSTIPTDGFVISGHGSAAQWMRRFAKPGALVALEEPSAENPNTRRQLLIRFTPQVYLHETDMAIQRAEQSRADRPTTGDSERYGQFMAQAKNCRTALAQKAQEGFSPELAELSQQCVTDADRAFYNTLQSRAEEFRGAWIRPDSTDPARIRQAVSALQEMGIQNVFLETYYQGKTIYPSEVMAEAGLPAQHPQYQARDGQKSDPLQTWMDEAHRQGLKVHLWAQVFFAGNAAENSEQYGPILNKYPQWRNVQRPHWNAPAPVPSDIEPGHYFLDPANPEVQAFLDKLLMEMVSRYKPDGLNLDYIRYPASAKPDKAWYLGTTWGYTQAARSAFRQMIEKERQLAQAKEIEALKKAGKSVPKMPPVPDPKDLTPSHPLWPRWVAWRKAQVSNFVKKISAEARAVKPDLLVSAVIFPSTDPDYAQKLQDYPRWARDGDIQALTPIGLSPRPDWMLNQSLQLQKQLPPTFPVYMGVFGMYNRAEPIDLLRQIETVHRADLAGLVLFDYLSRLTPAYRDALKEGPFRALPASAAAFLKAPSRSAESTANPQTQTENLPDPAGTSPSALRTPPANPAETNASGYENGAGGAPVPVPSGSTLQAVP